MKNRKITYFIGAVILASGMVTGCGEKSADSNNNKNISLGSICSGAIANDGSLYMWGNNYSGF